MCDGLLKAKTALVNSKLYNMLGAVYLSELKDWYLIKNKFKKSEGSICQLWITLKNKKVTEFNLQLMKRHYTNIFSNFQNVHFWFLLKYKLTVHNTSNKAAGLLTANIFFVYWNKEIDIEIYGDDIPLLLLTNRANI